MRARATALLAVAAIGLGACGDDEEENADLPAAVPANPVETTTTATTTAAAGATQTGGATRHGISTDLSTKPEIPKPSGEPPAKLVVRDVVKGRGKAAKLDDDGATGNPPSIGPDEALVFVIDLKKVG